ncbi:MAG: class I SAM-dependent methyltransferase [Thaumarchaeota archaeon]|nr:class I SAM-dependent methyltransferase [Nitrososphaerota archaeon]
MADSLLARRGVGYDVPAEGYDELYGEEQIEKYSAIVSELEREFAGISVVADVGCGTGLLGEYLRTLGFGGIYIGVDLVLERLESAKHRADSSWMLIQADAEHLPLRSRSIDLVACVTVIHLLDVERAVRELIRISRGYLAITLLKKRIDLRDRILQSVKNFTGEVSMKEILREDLRDLIIILSYDRDVDSNPSSTKQRISNLG